MTSLLHIIWLAAVLVSAFLMSGCNPPTTEKTATTKQVVRWKSYSAYSNSIGSTMGLVFEKDGPHVTATLYDLKQRDGFVVDREVAAGKYFPDRKAFVLIPSGAPLFASIEEWIKVNGMRFEVPLGMSATNLIATMKGTGLREIPTEFLRFRE